MDKIEFFAENRADWRKWLEENHQTSSGVWLVFNKKSSGKSHISYEEGVEEALCFGWIDSKGGIVNEEQSKLYYAPRNPRSNWSRPNKERIARLTSAGLMREAGLKMVEIAQKTGTWTALDDVENLVVPVDLQVALDAWPSATSYFNAFPRSVKRGILEWILNAKTPKTRAKRIEETARLANENIRANQYKRPA